MASYQQHRSSDSGGEYHQPERVREFHERVPRYDPAWCDHGGACSVFQTIESV